MEEEIKRVINNLYQRDNDHHRYKYLMGLQDINEKLFFNTIKSHLNYCLPLISTPTISEACREFGLSLLRPRGLYLSMHDRGHILSILANWPEKRVKAVCITDGESLLGIGDYGASGMGMAISKITLYTSEFYGGLREPRLSGEEYFSFVEEVLRACRARYGPNVCLHFTDFSRENTFKLREKYASQYRCFFDEVEAASASILAGIMSAARARNSKLSENKYLMVGAGTSLLSTAQKLVKAMMMEGVSKEKAHSLIYMIDSKGLIVEERPRGGIDERKAPFAHNDLSPMDHLEEIVRAVRPTMLIGASSTKDSFTREIMRDMASFNKKPVIMALSDPVELAECQADLAFKSTECRSVSKQKSNA
ncbi:hypothetical protein Ciccas_013653 [Cichlidogyrus casuarinus]|uniref:Malic enzyme n=1 Tax=Cichlidogyrus casuarinus TaxID=1844966 RepID=A0ABD2PK13_9PLAT